MFLNPTQNDQCHGYLALNNSLFQPQAFPSNEAPYDYYCRYLKLKAYNNSSTNGERRTCR